MKTKSLNPLRVDATGKLSKQNLLAAAAVVGGALVGLNVLGVAEVLPLAQALLPPGELTPEDLAKVEEAFAVLAERGEAAVRLGGWALAGYGAVNFALRTWWNQGRVYEP